MHFLIVKTSSLGDIIHTFPLVSYLHAQFPQAAIDWVVEEACQELVKAHPLVSKVIPFNSRRWRKALSKKTTWQEMARFDRELRREQYEAIFDVQGNCKSGWITMRARGRAKVGFAHPPEWPNRLVTNWRVAPPQGQSIREDYLALGRSYCKDERPFVDPGVELKISSESASWLDHFCASLPRKRRVLVCPGAQWLNKQLPFEKLSAYLRTLEGSFFLFAWGSGPEKEQAMRYCAAFPESLLLERLPLPLLQKLMGRMDLVVAMDSLPLHLAGTTSVATFSFFGPSLAQKYRPLGEQHHSWQGGCPYKVQFEKRCPKLRTCSTGACMREIDDDKLPR